MGKKIFNSALCLWLLITGCATLNRHNVFDKKVTGNNSILIGMRLKDEMLNLGYHIREQSDDSIVFEKQITDPTVATWHRDRYDMYPSSRVSYMLIEQNRTIRIVADLKIIINSGSDFERLAKVAKHPDYKSIQEILQNIENQLERKKKQDLLYPNNTKSNLSRK